MEYIITNPSTIIDLIDTDIKLFPESDLYDTSDVKTELYHDCYNKATELYGTLDQRQDIAKRIEAELDSMAKNDFSLYYAVARKTAEYSNGQGYAVGARGCIGGSLAAYLLGITGINPLKPHYRCSSCKTVEFDVNVSDGYDLPELICPNCGGPMIGDGHNIPFEPFGGLAGDKRPDIDINIAEEIASKVSPYLQTVFPKYRFVRGGCVRTLRASRAKEEYGDTDLEKQYANIKIGLSRHPGKLFLVPDFVILPLEHTCESEVTHFNVWDTPDYFLHIELLPHTWLSILAALEKSTGVNLMDIPMNDPQVYEMFRSIQPLGIQAEDIECDTSTLTIPEFASEYDQEIIRVCKPKCFSDLVKVYALTHGTGIWKDNAEILIGSGEASLSQIPASRDDIFEMLLNHGFAREAAWKIMEDIRKGRIHRRGFDHTTKKEIESRGLPEWFIGLCEKTLYMFPKAHCVSCTIPAVQAAWYQLHDPQSFYEAVVEVRNHKRGGIG